MSFGGTKHAQRSKGEAGVHASIQPNAAQLQWVCRAICRGKRNTEGPCNPIVMASDSGEPIRRSSRKRRAGWSKRNCRISLSPRSSKVGSVGEAAELFLHGLGQHRLHGRQDRSHAGEFLIEVAGIGRAADGGDEWRRATLVVNVIPVDVPEECMRHHLLGIGGTGAQTQFRLTGQELLQNRNRVARHVDGIEGLISKDGIVDLILIFTAERRLLQEHLVDKNTKGPPINSSAILLVQQNLFKGQYISAVNQAAAIKMDLLREP